MNPITKLTKSQLSEKEAIIYLLIESGMGLRDLAKRLGVSHYYIGTQHDKARKKIERLVEAGLFSTEKELKKAVKAKKD